MQLSRERKGPPPALRYTSEAEKVEELRGVSEFLLEAGLKPLDGDSGYLEIMYLSASEEIAKAKEELQSLSFEKPDDLRTRLDDLSRIWREFKSTQAGSSRGG